MFNFSDLHISINPFICAEIASSARAIGASLRKGVDRHKPDKSLTARREASDHRPRKKYIEISPDMLKELRAELERTNAKPAAIFRARPPSLRGLTEIKISHWRTGRVKRADPTEWAYVMKFLRSLPDKA